MVEITSRCPTTGKECSACGIIGHFGKVCQNSKREHYSRANAIHSQTAGTADAQNNHFDYLEDDYTYIIRECQPLRDHVAIAKSNTNKLPLCTIKLNTVSRALSLNELRDATAQDSPMNKLQEAIRTQRCDDELVRSYKQVRSEFASHDGLILRGTRIVIPEALQQHVIDLAHTGHQGTVKNKRLLREKVWFPGIDRLAERRIQ